MHLLVQPDRPGDASPAGMPRAPALRYDLKKENSEIRIYDLNGSEN
jgi:hypothetical protein